MSILLDAVPCPGWDRMFTEREAAALTDAEIMTDAMPAGLKWIIGSVDLSWDERIPMLDFANSLFNAVSSLPLHRKAEFISAELVPWTRLTLDDDGDVAVSRDGKPEVARTGYAELLKASAEFGLRVYESFISAFPAAKDSPGLKSLFLLDKMKAAARRSNGLHWPDPPKAE